jgi:hypothetical protein
VKRTKVSKGQVYMHNFPEGGVWKVRVTSIDRKDVTRKGYFWGGVLVGDQGDCKDGDPCCGRTSELNEIR